ncbi:MAG TPA: PAS domain-containing protein [Lysobacter sp.]|nr:PAS domain-containing protein [Lysobacter sp.]
MPESPDFAALFEVAPYPFLLIGTDYTLIAANRAYLAATGRTAEDIVGKHIFEAFPLDPDNPESTNLGEVRLSIDLAISTGKPHTSPLLRYAVPRDTPEGRVFDERYWSAVHTPVLDEHGNVLFVCQNAIDVTDLYRFDPVTKRYFLKDAANAVPDVTELDRPQLHEAITRILNVERNQLQTLFDQAPGFIAVLMGKDHVFEMVNRAYYQLVGHRDIIGRPVMEALPEVAGQGFEEILDQVFETGKPLVFTERQVRIQRDPTGPLTERYVDLLYQPIFGDDGRVIGIFNQGNDVTEGYMARRALAEKVEELAQARQTNAFQLQLADRLRALREPGEIFRQSAELIGRHFNANRVVYGDYDREQKKVTYHSNYVDGTVAELTGTYPSARFGAANFDSIASGALWVSNDLSRDPRTAGPETWPTFESLQIRAAVAVPLTRDGATIACLFVNTSTPRAWSATELDLLKDAADRVWTAVERVRAEIALKAADERKDQFLAMLAHELRNPLAPIRAAADILSMAPADVERVKTASAIIARQVKHMTSLVDDLLDVSRVTRGLVSLEKRNLDLKNVLVDALEQVRPMLEARRHRLTVQLTPSDAHVSGDQKRLVQVLANLLNNAAKYTPDGGLIDVAVEVDEECVLVTVADDGIGMSADVAERAFELFAQADRTSDRTQGGLGIGLALVKRLVELHEGSVRASSRGANAGSEFVVRLPRLRTDRLPPPRKTDGVQPATKPLRVLIVDDNEDAAATLGMLVEALGHTALVEHSAHQGLERAIAEKPDACLLDIGLPGMDGNELACELRRNLKAADPTLIAVSGYGQDGDRQRTAEAGFDHHLVKPVDAGALSALLATSTQPRTGASP